MLNFGFFKICRCRLLLISCGARRKILKFQRRSPVLKFYVTPMKDNFFMPLGGALKFKIAPLKGRFLRRFLLRKFLIPMPRVPFLKFHTASLKDKFCVTLARCFGISRRARKRLNFKIYALFWRGKISNLLLQSRILNFTLCHKFRFYRPHQNIAPASFAASVSRSCP